MQPILFHEKQLLIPFSILLGLFLLFTACGYSTLGSELNEANSTVMKIAPPYAQMGQTRAANVWYGVALRSILATSPVPSSVSQSLPQKLAIPSDFAVL